MDGEGEEWGWGGEGWVGGVCLSGFYELIYVNERLDPDGYRLMSVWLSESDLQVCVSKNLTCCTKKMEEKYQLAARRDVQNLLQTSSSGLKLLISRNVAALQGRLNKGIAGPCPPPDLRLTRWSRCAEAEITGACVDVEAALRPPHPGPNPP